MNENRWSESPDHIRECLKVVIFVVKNFSLYFILKTRDNFVNETLLLEDEERREKKCAPEHTQREVKLLQTRN
jgi:hypothetical protein